MKKLIILEKENFSKKVINLLKEHFDVHFLVSEEKKLNNIFQNFDIVWFRLGYRITPEILTGQIKCKYIVTPVTGLNHIDEKTCIEKGVKILSLRGEYKFLKTIRATAEHTLGLTLALLRKIPQSFDDVKKGKWNRDSFRGNEILEKTVGIIGLGRLGEIVAEYFSAFGAKIIYYDKNNKISNKFKSTKTLEELLKTSDIISLHIDYTPENLNFLQEKHFKMMKKSAIFINTSRGELVDEEALLKALKNKMISGAALDVIQNEHLFNKNNLLIKHAIENDNLIITPHIGGNTFESFQKTEEFMAYKLINEVCKNKQHG